MDIRKLKNYDLNTPIELLKIEPISRHYYFQDKEEVRLFLSHLRYKQRKVKVRLQALLKHDFPGRIETIETKTLKKNVLTLEEDIIYLKTIMLNRFSKKRGRKPSKRKAKRIKTNG